MTGAGHSPEEGTRLVAARLLRAAARGEPCAGPYLVVHDGAGAPRRVELDGELTVGRGPAAALRLGDAGVSRLHARFRVGPDGGATVEDLGSKNGVRRNGLPVVGGPSPLRPGDAVVVGATTLVYADPLAALPAAAPPASLAGVPAQAPAGAPADRASQPGAPGPAPWLSTGPALLLAAGAALLALAAALLAAA